MCLGSKLTNKVKKLIIYFFQRSGDTKCVLKIAEYTHCMYGIKRFDTVHGVGPTTDLFPNKPSYLKSNLKTKSLKNQI